MRPLFACLLVLAAFVLSAAGADAAFTPAALVSGTQLVPFEQAGSPALSGDGRYVVFQGVLAGAPGVYRRDLLTGEVTAVASAAKEPAIDAPDAGAPSISADGRYVAFTTTAVLDTAAKPGAGCPQVYIRDMSLTPGAPAAYRLASALSGSEEGLAYASCPVSGASGFALAGAQAAAGVALSADGRRVAFTVLSSSDLTTGNEAQRTTEPSQVVVRDLVTQTTALVSVTPSGEATPGGGAFPSSESERLGARSPETTSDQPAGSSAAISADGSTVAWLGTNIPTQVPPATDVTDGMAALGSVATEVEPLWRRMADGPAAVTRRLLSQAGMNLYFGGSFESVQPVNGGSLYPSARDFVPPVLDADGRRVAVIANAPTPANEASYGYLSSSPMPPADAYIVSIGENPAAPPLVTPLTATPSFTARGAIFGGVRDISMSPDGSRAAFNTLRTSFSLAPPTLVSPPAPEAANAYTYEANMALGTLQRVTSTYDGSAPNGEPGSMSFSGDGLSLALASSAGNLFYGDATPGASQVYLIHELPTASQLAPLSIGRAPITPLPVPVWALNVTATPQADGSVTLDAQVPGAGRLGARATAQLPSTARVSARSLRRAGTRWAVHVTVRKGGKKTSPRGGVTIPARTVALGGVVAGGPSELQMRMRADTRYRALVAGRDGLYALLRVTFTAHGHRTLVQNIPVTFRVRARKKVRA